MRRLSDDEVNDGECGQATREMYTCLFEFSQNIQGEMTGD